MISPVVTFLDALFLQPLMVLYRTVFGMLPSEFGIGPQIIFFSIAINALLLPAYFAMERSSKSARELQSRVAGDVARMKRHFKGRERYYYIQAVYRQHRYRPISALWTSADLFVQILVFATVFRFLLDLSALIGASFGPIANLAEPDRLLGGVNLLPLLMTVINIASVVAYIDDRDRRLQAGGLAALFLVLLYNSPSGLVLYWTANNLFSLVRNVGQRALGRRPVAWSDPVEKLLRQQ